MINFNFTETIWPLHFGGPKVERNLIGWHPKRTQLGCSSEARKWHGSWARLARVAWHPKGTQLEAALRGPQVERNLIESGNDCLKYARKERSWDAARRPESGTELERVFASLWSCRDPCKNTFLPFRCFFKQGLFISYQDAADSNIHYQMEHLCAPPKYPPEYDLNNPDTFLASKCIAQIAPAEIVTFHASYELLAKWLSHFWQFLASN